MCKFGNKNVFLTLWHFWWIFFFFLCYSNFKYYRNCELSIFLKIVSATFLGLITHIIKLFQSVQIQKVRFRIC